MVRGGLGPADDRAEIGQMGHHQQIPPLGVDARHHELDLEPWSPAIYDAKRAVGDVVTYRAVCGAVPPADVDEVLSHGETGEAIDRVEGPLPPRRVRRHEKPARIDHGDGRGE